MGQNIMTILDFDTVFEPVHEHYFYTNTDEKGRKFGYVAALREVKSDADEYGVEYKVGQCYAWVQRVIVTKDGWEDFGIKQRSKVFESVEKAVQWVYPEVHKRANIVKGN